MGSNRELAQSKLILLYVINKLGMPVNNLQVTKIILENKFMNYFFLQQFLNELCESHLLESTMSEGKTVYTITAAGKQTLEYFATHIPAGLRNRIDNVVSSIRKNIKKETLITADFIPDSENEFTVICRVHEDNFSLIEMRVAVGSKNDARTICSNWKKHSQAIYAEIIESLTRQRDKDGAEDGNNPDEQN